MSAPDFFSPPSGYNSDLLFFVFFSLLRPCAGSVSDEPWLRFGMALLSFDTCALASFLVMPSKELGPDI